MNFSYILGESISGFKRAKLSSVISIFTIGISLVLFGAFLTLSLNASKILSDIRSRVEVEFFLSETLKELDSKMITGTLRTNIAVQNAVYISKDSAAHIFKSEFGEDVVTILGTNPLPSSIKVKLKSDYATIDSLESFIAAAFTLTGIIDARYNKAFLAGLDKNARLLFYITCGLGLMISISAIALVSNTIRLVITSKRDMIRTMMLVGATNNFIRSPFLIEGAIQGFLGGATAILILLLVQIGVGHFFYELSEQIEFPDYRIFGLLAAIGTFLGFFGSFISIRKFLLTS